MFYFLFSENFNNYTYNYGDCVDINGPGYDPKYYGRLGPWSYDSQGCSDYNSGKWIGRQGYLCSTGL